MRLHSYVVAHDTGFSPNPFWGRCTLACCKPTIRRTANVGDWVVGLSPKKKGNRLIYAMEVEEILTYDAYYRDARFATRIPNFSAGQVVARCGDNIYKPLLNGRFRQLESMHSNGPNENPKTKKRDLRGERVLIARRFHYFGSKALRLPKQLSALKVGRAHKNRFARSTIAFFLKFISSQPPGVVAPPSHWPVGNDSWRFGQECG